MSVPKNASVAKNRQKRYASWDYDGPVRPCTGKNKTKATNRTKPKKRK
jgi:hypothetical protein